MAVFECWSVNCFSNGLWLCSWGLYACYRNWLHLQEQWCINVQNNSSKMLVFDQYRAWYNNTVSLIRHIIQCKEHLHHVHCNQQADDHLMFGFLIKPLPWQLLSLDSVHVTVPKTFRKDSASYKVQNDHTLGCFLYQKAANAAIRDHSQMRTGGQRTAFVEMWGWFMVVACPFRGQF